MKKDFQKFLVIVLKCFNYQWMEDKNKQEKELFVALIVKYVRG